MGMTVASDGQYRVSGRGRLSMKYMAALLCFEDKRFLTHSGVDPLAVYDVQQIILQLKERNLGILITDHNVRETLSVVDRAYLMCQGKILVEGPSEFLVNDEQAREIYLGPQFSM